MLRMSKSDVVNALHDLKVLLGYDDRFDVQSIQLEYRRISCQEKVVLVFCNIASF